MGRLWSGEPGEKQVLTAIRVHMAWWRLFGAHGVVEAIRVHMAWWRLYGCTWRGGGYAVHMALIVPGLLKSIDAIHN